MSNSSYWQNHAITDRSFVLALLSVFETEDENEERMSLEEKSNAPTLRALAQEAWQEVQNALNNDDAGIREQRLRAIVELFVAELLDDIDVEAA